MPTTPTPCVISAVGVPVEVDVGNAAGAAVAVIVLLDRGTRPAAERVGPGVVERGRVVIVGVPQRQPREPTSARTDRCPPAPTSYVRTRAFVCVCGGCVAYHS